MSGLKIRTSAIQAGGEIKQVAWIQINNVESGNSFGPEESIALMDFLDSKAAKNIRAIVWTNELGFPFCRGGNLKYYKSLKAKAQGLSANREIRKSLKRLASLSIPTVALVRGDAFGGGMELISCFDFVFSTPAALMGFWQRKIGLTFGWGGGARALYRLPLGKLKSLALEARSLTAYEACDLGLVDQIVPSDIAEIRVQQKLQDLLSGSSETTAAIKDWSSKDETKIFEELWWTEEHRSKTSRPTRG